jgi:hypothetical protein
VTKPIKKIFKPLRVAAGLNAYNDLASELRVKGLYVIALMVKVSLVNLSVSGIAVTDGLKTCMKVYSAIYCHRTPPFAISYPLRV